MFQYICPIVQALLLSPAMTTELQTTETIFAAGITLKARDANGMLVPVTITSQIALPSLVQVDAAMPYRNIAGPFPRAFVYHMGSVYPKQLNEALIVTGDHKMGITLLFPGAQPQDGEQGAARYMSAIKSLLDRNQYLFSQLPAAGGRASLSWVPEIQIGAGMGDVQTYHLSFTVHIGELRAS